MVSEMFREGQITQGKCILSKCYIQKLKMYLFDHDRGHFSNFLIVDLEGLKSSTTDDIIYVFIVSEFYSKIKLNFLWFYL